MSEQWSKEFCPVCKTINWVYMGHEESTHDTTGYTCWSCKKEITMIRGDCDYDPHVAEPDSDDYTDLSVDGLENPK